MIKGIALLKEIPFVQRLALNGDYTCEIKCADERYGDFSAHDTFLVCLV